MNQVLILKDAGFGETPLPKDALCNPGDPMDITDANTGEVYKAIVLAVVPVGVPVEYARADQAIPKKPRPLMLEVRKPFKQTAYIIGMADQTVTILQDKMQKGLDAAKALADKNKTNPPAQK